MCAPALAHKAAAVEKLSATKQGQDSNETAILSEHAPENSTDTSSDTEIKMSLRNEDHNIQ